MFTYLIHLPLFNFIQALLPKLKAKPVRTASGVNIYSLVLSDHL